MREVSHKKEDVNAGTLGELSTALQALYPSIIIDSVESICRDTMYTQYMPIQKNLSKSQKRYTYKPF